MWAKEIKSSGPPDKQAEPQLTQPNTLSMAEFAGFRNAGADEPVQGVT
jgi:hypothetical protein